MEQTRKAHSVIGIRLLSDLGLAAAAEHTAAARRVGPVVRVEDAGAEPLRHEARSAQASLWTVAPQLIPAWATH